MKSLKVSLDEGEEKSIIVGSADEELSIQAVAWVELDENNVVTTEIHVNGYTEDHKYRWISNMHTGSKPLTFELVDDVSYDQPLDVSPRKKMDMPLETKLKLYHKLKRELEEKGLL